MFLEHYSYTDPLRLFAESGGFANLIVALAAVVTLGCVVATIMAFVAPRRALVLAIVTGVAGVGLLALGVAAQTDSRRRVDEAIANVSSEEKEIIRTEGYGESRAPLILALFFASIPLGVAAGLASLRADPQHAGRAWVLGGGVLSALGLAGGALVGMAYEKALHDGEIVVASVDPRDRATILASAQQEAAALKTPGLVCGALIVLGAGLAVAAASGTAPKAGSN